MYKRQARLGHECRGIDLSPASIAHAGYNADRFRLPIDYVRGDIRDGDYGADFDAVLLLFGEFNAFTTADVERILDNARACLRPGGKLVVEPHSKEYVRHLGQREANWFSAAHSVFSAQPHLCLHECHWHEPVKATTERYWVVDNITCEITEFVSTLQAYSLDECRSLLADAGFSAAHHPSLTGQSDPDQAGLFVMVGTA